MKQLYLLLAICLAFIKAEAQVIVGYEYFWDTDPGIDNATSVGGSSFVNADSVNITKTISTAGLSAGVHYLYVRTKDSDGKWSLAESQQVNVVALIVAYEYFWDTDPGIDNATSVGGSTFVNADSVNITKTISTAGLSAGVHYLYVRTKDSEGKWSLAETQQVNVVALIVAYEYFWDTDPGIDNATPVGSTAFVNADSVNITKTISTASLSAGIHYLYIRTKDSEGKWSLAETQQVNVVPIITRAEYFWDTDPGIGNGLLDTNFVHTDSINHNKTFSTTSLSAGIHYLYVRTKDNFGKWSLSEGLSVNVVPILVDYEYFWDTDPGIGNGFIYSIPAFAHLDSVNHTNTISTTGLIGGYHTLYVRTKDSEGKWGLSEGRTFYIQPIITQAEFFWDTDPGIDNATSFSVGTPLDSVNVNIPATLLGTSALSAGIHRLYVRTKDSGNHWSLSEGMAVEIKPYLVKGEYFLNTDPGIGNGTTAFTAPVGSPADSINGNYNISTTGLTYGRYYHYLRTMDNFGKWSLAEPRAFDVAMFITKVEYFIDTDPGVGLGINIPITSDDTVNITNFSIPATSLPAGWHNLYIRAKNDANVWSVIDTRQFYIQAPLNPTYTTNTDIEYFIDTDPGVGAATNIPIADADTLTLNNQAIVTTGLSAGFHQLYLRAKNNAGVWSVIDTRPFVVNVPPPAVTTITQLEYFYDTDPGVGNALSLALPGAPDDTVVVNTNKIVPCLTNGTHYLWLRAKNNLGVWSVVQHDTLTIGGTMIAKPITSLGPDTVCSPSTVTMYADSASGIAYQWLNNGTPISGSTFAKYTATVSGNYSLRQTCVASVVTSNIKNVVVNYVPDITFCPSVAPVNNDGGLCSAIVTYANATATGSSPLPVITYSQNSGTAFPVGSTTVYVVATNLCGVDSCQFNVVVADTALPAIANCPANVNLNNDAGLCSAIATWTAPTAADNCAIQTLTSSHNSGAAFPLGTTTVTYTATDIHGNIQTCSFNVLVTDIQLPVISNCPANISINNDPGTCGSPATWTPPTATDNCGVQPLTSNYNSGATFPVGTTTVTYTATDIHGNIQTCSFNIVVTDNEMPTITCPATITTCSTTPTLGIPATADNCGVDTVYNNAPTVFPVGTTTVIWTVEDIHGNINTCNQLVTVNAPATVTIGNDDEICAPNVVFLNGIISGSYTTSVWSTNGDGYFTNGSTLSPTYTPGTNDKTIGTVILTLTANGNPVSCTSYDTKIVKIRTTLPLQPSVVSGAPVSVCPPLTGVVLSVTNDANVTTYSWANSPGSNGITFNPPSTTNTQVIDIGTTTNSTYNIRVTATNACGSSLYRGVSIRRTTSTPASITGSVIACAGQSYPYSIAAVVGADTYTWTAPANASINGGGNTLTTASTSVNVQMPAVFTTGTLSVTANVACFVSSARTITLSTSTAALSLITGSAVACPGSIQTYTVPAVTGATSYQWTLPTYTSGTSSSNNINVTFNTGFSSANICVQATSTCGVQTIARCKSVATGLPPTPTAINGIANGICGQTVNYNTPAVPGATGYVWTLPAVASGSSTNNSILVTYQSTGITTAPLTVQSQNSCGLSLPRTITVKGAPNSPGVITANPASWCNSNSGITFTSNLANVTGSYNLVWSFVPPTAASIQNGQGSNNLLVDWNTGNATVILTASNSCGSGTKTYAAVVAGCREAGEEIIQLGENIGVYPNPANGKINVSIKSIEGVFEIQLLDISGKVVISKSLSSVDGTNEYVLDIENLSAGIYTLRINGSALRKQFKVVISN